MVGALFLPRDFTSGCTIEAHGFQDALADLKVTTVRLLRSAQTALMIMNPSAAVRGLVSASFDPDGAVSRTMDRGWLPTRCAIPF